MTSSCEFEFLEYVDENSIDPNLLCSICHKPFKDPVCTSCDHTYGRECITHWLKTSATSSCPTCVKQPLLVGELVQASRPLRNMLDQLRVRCTLCEQTGLQRGNFLDHITKFCPKAAVQCQAADINCPWEGPREALQEHVDTCVFAPLRPVLGPLLAENRQLVKQVQRHEVEIKRLTAKITQMPSASTEESDNESVHSTTTEPSAHGTDQKEEDAIFIRNLPTTAKFNDVFEFFSKIGRIKYDEKSQKAGLFIFKNPNNTSGYCTAKVIYDNKETAAAAVGEFDHKHVPQWNTHLRVSISNVRKDPPKASRNYYGKGSSTGRPEPQGTDNSQKRATVSNLIDLEEPTTAQDKPSTNKNPKRRPQQPKQKNAPAN